MASGQPAEPPGQPGRGDGEEDESDDGEEYRAPERRGIAEQALVQNRRPMRAGTLFPVFLPGSFASLAAAQSLNDIASRDLQIGGNPALPTPSMAVITAWCLAFFRRRSAPRAGCLSPSASRSRAAISVVMRLLANAAPFDQIIAVLVHHHVYAVRRRLGRFARWPGAD